MENKNDISVKNYLLLGGILLLTISLSLYFYFWHLEYVDNNINKTVFYDNLQNIQYNELDDFLVENKDAIVYFSGERNVESRKFENKFNKLISKYFVNYHVLYLNISDELKNDSMFREIKNKYGVNVPFIIVIKDGEIISKFNIKNNDYNIDLLKDFLIDEGIIND